MTDYQKYINALRKCAKEHENDRTFTGHIIVSDLCRDTANLLEALEQEPKTGQRSFPLESIDEDAKETVSHLIECYEDGCFTKDERVTLAGIALKARIRFQLNKYKEREDGNDN